jgi:predicted Holliday junction resolvase-like endonuclease
MKDLIYGLNELSLSLGATVVVVVAFIILTYFLTRHFYMVRKNRIFRKRSHAVMTGLVNEQFASMIHDFPGSGSDSRFIGSPVDYIVFNGLSHGCVSEVIFVEVKTHSGVRLSSTERTLRDAIENGRVRWTRFDTQ